MPWNMLQSFSRENVKEGASLVLLNEKQMLSIQDILLDCEIEGKNCLCPAAILRAYTRQNESWVPQGFPQ